MIGSHRFRAAAIAVAASACLGQLAFATPAHALAISVFAAPNGSGTDCSATSPCSITQAFAQATGGSFIDLADGSYGSPSAPLTTELAGANDVSLLGTGVAKVAIFVHSSSDSIHLSGADSYAENFTLYSASPNAGLILPNGGSADHVAVYASSGTYGACGIYGGTLLDALCVQTGADLPAFAMSTGGATDTLIKDSTLVATAAGGMGISTYASDDVTTNIAVTNSIVKGAGVDIYSDTSNAGSSATVNLSYSDYTTTDHGSGGGTTTVTAGPHNISAPPTFVSAAELNFKETPASPTVDKGSTALAPQGHDIAGNPRTLGKATDIGAFELLPAPSGAKVKVKATGKGEIKLAVSANPHGLATTAVIVAVRHGKKSTATPSLGSGIKKKTIHFSLSALKRHATYRIHLTVKSAGGKDKAKSVKAKTK
jgi:hypothetical protein